MRCRDLKEAEEKVLELRKELDYSVVICIETRNGILEHQGYTYCLLSRLDCPYQAKCEGKLDYCGKGRPYLFKNNS